MFHRTQKQRRGNAMQRLMTKETIPILNISSGVRLLVPILVWKVVSINSFLGDFYPVGRTVCSFSSSAHRVRNRSSASNLNFARKYDGEDSKVVLESNDGRLENYESPGLPGVNKQKTQKSRRKKKNKYAKFSKADSTELDPWEQMVESSAKKRKKLEDELASKDPRKAAPIKRNPNEKRDRDKFFWPDVKDIDPYDPTTYGYVELGTVIGAHGVKGEIRLLASTDFVEMRICSSGPRHLRLPNRRSPREIKLISGRKQVGDKFIVLLEGITDREKADKLKGSILYAREDERPEVENDEYYISDLVGVGVFVSEKGNEDDSIHVGVVSGIVLAEDICAIPGLGNDMLELSLPRESGQKEQELVLIPFVPEIVYHVELKQKRVYIDPPAGLLDLTFVKEEKVRIKGFLPPGKVNNS